MHHKNITSGRVVTASPYEEPYPSPEKCTPTWRFKLLQTPLSELYPTVINKQTVIFDIVRSIFLSINEVQSGQA